MPLFPPPGGILDHTRGVPQLHPIHPHNVPFPQGQIAPQMRDALGAHFAAFGQQFGQQFGAHPGPLFASGGPNVDPNHQQQSLPAHVPPAPTLFHQAIAQQQQARAAAGLHGVPLDPIIQTVPQPAPVIRQMPTDTNAQANTQTANNDLGNIHTTVREGQGPDGTHWRVVVNERSALVPNPRRENHSPSPADRHLNPTPTSAPSYAALPPPQLGFGHNPAQSWLPPRSASRSPWRPSPIEGLGNAQRNTLAIIQQQLSALEATIDNGGAPSEDDISQARIRLGNLMSERSALHSHLETSFNTRLNNLSVRAAQARARQGTSIRPSVSRSLSPTPTSSNPMVYLLSSPNGPHALLISPSGTYSTSWQTPAGGSIFHPSLQQQHFVQGQDSSNSTTVDVNNATRQQLRANDYVQDGQAGQEQRQEDQARNLAQLFLPLAGPLWLMIRLLGFMYFFTSGAGWRRTILLGICAILVFIAQTGVFRPLQQAVWDPFRRHIEDLVPLAGNGPRGPPPRGGHLDDLHNVRVEAGRTDGPVEPPRPGDGSRERGAGEGGIIRANLSRVERAVALFLASLVPGVGERHIAARDAEEAARRAQEREREERHQQEIEDRQREVVQVEQP